MQTTMGKYLRKPGRIATSLLMLTLAGTGPALAQQTPPQAEPPTASVDLDAVARRLQNYFTEEELRTLFDYMRDMTIAALQGKGDEVLLPPDLAFKMAILQERMMREGQFQMQLMMKQLERDIDKAMKDMFTFPPPSAPPAEPPTKTETAPPAPPVNPYNAPQAGSQRPANPYLKQP